MKEIIISGLIDGLNKIGRSAQYPELVRSAVINRKREIYNSFEYLLGENPLGVDIGAGDGTMTKINSPSRLFALDLQPQKCTGVNLPFIQARAEDLPFSDGSLDYVTIIYRLHHFDDPLRAFSEAVRVLKPNGILVVFEEHARYKNQERIMKVNDVIANRTIFPNKSCETDRYSSQSSFFTQDQLKALFNVHSLKNLNQKYYAPSRWFETLYKSAKYLYILKK